MLRSWCGWMTLLCGLCLALPTLAQSRHEPGFGPSPGHRPPHRGGPPGGPGMGGPPLGREIERYADRLGLEQETQERIHEISEASRVAREAEREPMHALHDELRKTLALPAPDEAKVMDLAERIGAMETQKQKRRLRTLLSIRALLTPEQLAELVVIHEEERERRPKRRGRPGGRERSPPGDEEAR